MTIKVQKYRKASLRRVTSRASLILHSRLNFHPEFQPIVNRLMWRWLRDLGHMLGQW